MALIEISARGPLESVRLGRSNDLMLGEDVLVIGNPSGLNHTVAPGIVSGLNRSGGPALTSARIQTTAAVNPGNSGGPLFNALGEMIGIVHKKMDADNIGFAIQIDRLREVFPELMSPEERFGLLLGMKADTMNRPVTVTQVTAESPADVAGVRVGDQLLRAGDTTLRHGLDFYLALIGRSPKEPFPLELMRDGKAVFATPILGEHRPPEPVEIERLESGLQFALYVGHWNESPDFDELEPTETGTCVKFSHDPGGKNDDRDRDHFAVKLTGYIEIPADGLYFFYTKSDDGSRLYVAGRLVVDNDLPHPVRELGGQIRLNAGRYPITATFFELDEVELLEVSYQGPNLPKQEIPAAALFFKP